ncbi:MAG: hypothetical protein R2731_13160 [Nocardioides sp.]
MAQLKPRYNRTIQQVHIHHTATGSDYKRGEVPKLLRAIYRYHTKTLKWSDIGYNFVVDRFGRAWVGRAGAWAGGCAGHTPWASTTPRSGSRCSATSSESPRQRS